MLHCRVGHGQSDTRLSVNLRGRKLQSTKDYGLGYMFPILYVRLRQEKGLEVTPNGLFLATKLMSILANQYLRSVDE